MEKVLVTGGAGFIGSLLVEKISPGYEILIVDNLHPQVHGANAKPPPTSANVCFEKIDITQRSAFTKAVQDFNPHIVYHLAAETGTGQSMDEVHRYCETNVTGTATLLEALRACSNTRRFVLASSRAVYGEGAWRNSQGQIRNPDARKAETMAKKDFIPRLGNERMSEPMATSETLEPRPTSVYASTKLMQEYLVNNLQTAAKWSAITLRFQNVYGRGQSLKNPYTGVLSIFASQILQNKKLNIFEDGQIVRDFVYRDDVVDALVLAGQSQLTGVYNIGTGQPAKIIDVAKELSLLLGRSASNMDITGDFRAGDIRFAVADTEKTHAELGWQAKISLDEGLARLATWVKDEVKT